MTNYPVFEASEQCTRCKGRCCKQLPGHYAPTDFTDLSFDGLKAEIEKGAIAIDWWESDPKEYYLRARHLDEAVVHGSWGGICVNLTPNGCRLAWKNRPLGCRSLKPAGRCINLYPKEACKDEWKPYDAVLCQLVVYFGGHEAPFVDTMEEVE